MVSQSVAITHTTEPECGYAKGRNGYFNLARLSVETGAHRAGEVSIHCYSQRSTYPGPAYLVISAEEALELAESLRLIAKAAQSLQ